MKFKHTMTKFLTNKLVLNIVSLIALLNVIGYIITDRLNAVIYFIIISILVRYFSKNMIIVLGIPLILVNLLSVKGNVMEGLENNETIEQNIVDQNNSSQNGTNQDYSKIINKINNQKNAKSNQGLPITPLDNNVVTNEATNNAITDESFEVGRGKKKGNDIDYASTIEDAYDELNKILGSDGIKRLTSDTQNLMKQQMQLAESMNNMAPLIKGMTPMIEQAKTMMSSMGDGNNSLSGLMDMAKKLTGNNA